MRHASFAPARRTFLLVLLFVTAAIATVSTGYAQSVVASTIDTATLDPRTGNVTVTGTVTCSETAVLEVLVTVRQSRGSAKLTEGAGGATVTCGTSATAYTVTTAPLLGSGRFHAGEVSINAFAQLCTASGCEGSRGVDATVQLRPSR